MKINWFLLAIILHLIVTTIFCYMVVKHLKENTKEIVSAIENIDVEVEVDNED